MGSCQWQHSSPAPINIPFSHQDSVCQPHDVSWVQAEEQCGGEVCSDCFVGESSGGELPYLRGAGAGGEVELVDR